MSKTHTTQGSRSHWAWWVLVALLFVALVIDAADGYFLKLLSSATFFLSATSMAATRPPRRASIKLAASTLLAVGLASLGYRLWLFTAG